MVWLIFILFANCKKDEDTNDQGNNNNPGTVTDIDGNTYKTVKIGNQVWMAEALKTSRYNDGTSVNNNAEGYYTFDETGSEKSSTPFVKNSEDVQFLKLCPQGWHIPTKAEWTELFGFVAHDNSGAYGGSEGKALKSKTGWIEGGIGDDIYGFNAKGRGAYNPDSARVVGIGEATYIMSSEKTSGGPWIRDMYYFNDAFHETTGWFEAGYSVRCMKD